MIKDALKGQSQVCFFADRSVTGVVYLYMLEEFLMLILKEKALNGMLVPQDGVPSLFHIAVRAEVLDRKFSRKWIGSDWRPYYLASPFP